MTDLDGAERALLLDLLAQFVASSEHFLGQDPETDAALWGDMRRAEAISKKLRGEA